MTDIVYYTADVSYGCLAKESGEVCCYGVRSDYTVYIFCL